MGLTRLLGAGVLALWGSAAMAAGPSVYYSPEIAPALTAPSWFDGLYAGALTGLVSAQHGNFFTSGAPMRFEATGLAGWGTSVAPGIVVSGEVQASVNSDFTTATDFDAMALGRLGFLSDDRFMTYAILGAGWFANATAFEAGLGYEWLASGNLSLRLEGVGIGQIGGVPNGNNWPGISAVRLTSGAVWHFNGQSEMPPAAESGPPTDFTGGYAGLYSGAWANPKYDFFVDYGRGGHLSRVAFGAVAGWNFALGDNFRVGVEGQGGPTFDSSGDVGVDALALAHLGLVPTPGLMPYVAGGLGVLEGKGAYAFGGGLEYALWGRNTLRGELLAVGEMGGAPLVPGITAGKLTVSSLFHFD
jgi:hypothetical protein